MLYTAYFSCCSSIQATESKRAALTSSAAAFVSVQNLVEKITRNKIYASVYWKKDCFGLSAETLVDKAVELKYVGGMTGEPQKPTEFICLILKMLQIQPDKEIIIEFIKNDDYKYVRLLGGSCISGGRSYYQPTSMSISDMHRPPNSSPPADSATSQVVIIP